MDVNVLIETQLRLECKGTNAEGLLARIPGPDPDDIPRCLVLRHNSGYRVLFRHDLAFHIRERIATLPPEVVFDDRQMISAVLAEDVPVESIWIGRSYIFPSAPAPAEYPDVVRLDRDGARSVYAIRIDDQIVASCESAREDDAAAEAWVQTLPEFRRRGYARQVTAAWAHDLMGQGKIPFYSHNIDNLASQGVARSLGLIPFIDGVGYA
jgi:predicted GNAT family acetyltransferase